LQQHHARQRIDRAMVLAVRGELAEPGLDYHVWRNQTLLHLGSGGLLQDVRAGFHEAKVSRFDAYVDELMRAIGIRHQQKRWTLRPPGTSRSLQHPHRATGEGRFGTVWPGRGTAQPIRRDRAGGRPQALQLPVARLSPRRSMDQLLRSKAASFERAVPGRHCRPGTIEDGRERLITLASLGL
jgi:hypothetical protein